MREKSNRGPQRGARVKQSNVKQYICLVDHYRRPSRQRNTAGRYRVGARNPDEARALLQKQIGCGSVQVYYEEQCPCGADRPTAFGECLKETFIPGQRRFVTSPAVRYDAPMETRGV